MPFRLGMPQRKFNVFVFDWQRYDKGDESDWHYYFTWFADTPEQIYSRFDDFCFNAGVTDLLKLVEINEVLWECVLND